MIEVKERDIETTATSSEVTSPIAIIQAAMARYPKLMMTSGFNLNGIVLIDLAAKAGFTGKVLFVDTGYHFKETLDTRDKLIARYPQLDFITLSANRPDDRMFTHDVDTCCALRKVAPLQDHLKEVKPDALLSARSRDQGGERQHLRAFESGKTRDKVNPLAFWTQDQLEAYAVEHELDVNPLYWEGFLSIGCGPCTRAVKPGEDARAGRWPGLGKTECGLWSNEAI